VAIVLWEKNGLLMGNAGLTALLECEDCPCGEPGCDNCDAGTYPSTITATLQAGMNLFGGGLGCAVDCDDWAAAWELPLLTQGQVDTLIAAYPFAFTQGATAGCYYGLTVGLPCGANALVFEITAGGTSGTARGNLSFCWSDSVYVIFECEITTAGGNNNCVANFNTGGTGLDNITIVTGGVPPCDFLGAWDTSLTDIQAGA